MTIARRAPNWLSQWVYAHRGLHSDDVPENSIAAAQAAITAGMGIECDIQRSRDDQPMVFHDWELGRLAGVEANAGDLTAEELERLSLLGTDEAPVRLSKFLNVIDGQVPLLIEVKSKPGYDVERSCGLISAALKGYRGEHAVMSFDPRVGGWFAENDPDRTRGIVCTDSLDLGFLKAWREAGALELAQPDFLAMDIRDLPNSICSLWRANGKPLLSWTIRSRELREKVSDLIDAPIAEGAGIA